MSENGLEKITQRIDQDIEQEINQIRAQTQGQVDAITASAAAERQKVRDELLTRGRIAAQERLERLESAAYMETRKLKLAAKQEVLGEAFDAALEKLCSLPDEEYIKLLTDLAVRASTSGKERVIFSTKDRNRIGKQVVTAVNETLAAKTSAEQPQTTGRKAAAARAIGNSVGHLTLSRETRNLTGGFIMVDGDIELNCAFDALVRSQREQLERDVARILFD